MKSNSNPAVEPSIQPDRCLYLKADSGMLRLSQASDIGGVSQDPFGPKVVRGHWVKYRFPRAAGFVLWVDGSGLLLMLLLQPPGSFRGVAAEDGAYSGLQGAKLVSFGCELLHSLTSLNEDCLGLTRKHPPTPESPESGSVELLRPPPTTVCLHGRCAICKSCSTNQSDPKKDAIPKYSTPLSRSKVYFQDE